MALSQAMEWALANGMTEDDVYNNINNWQSQFSNANSSDRQAAMAQYGISDADVAAAQSRLTKVIPGGNTVLEDKSTFDPGKSGLESLTVVTPTITGGISTLVTPVVTPVSIPVTPVNTFVTPVVTPDVIPTPVVTVQTPVVTVQTPVVTLTTPTPAADTSTFNYESVYDTFGGKDATNALIAQIRAMGLSDSQIAEVFAPYQKTTIATPVVTPVVTTETILTPTPVVTSVVTSVVTPVVTPIVTSVVTPVVLGTPVVTPIVTPIVTPVVTTVVTPTPAVEALVTPTVSPSTVSIDTLAVAGSNGNLLNVPGYGELSTSTLNSWEPWRLTMLGITKNADGTFSYGGGPAWETTVGTTNRALFDQINNISNLSGMSSAYTGGALGKDDGGLGSKEAVLWDFANKLSSQGVTSLADIGRRMVTRTMSSEQGDYTVEEEEIYNKATGKAINIQGTTLGGNQTNYGFTFTNTGLAIPTTTGTKSDWVDFTQNVLPMVLTAVSVMYPAAAPYIQSYNAAKAAANGQWAAAAFSGLAAASGFSGQIKNQIDALANAGKFAEAEQLFNDSWLAQNAGTLNTAKDVASVVNAVDTKNIAGAINAGMNLAGATLPPEVRTAVNWANLGKAIADNDYAGMVNAASTLTGSSDLKVAASAANFVKAFTSGNISAIASAGANFGNTIKGLGDVATNVTTTPTTTVASAGSSIIVGTDADGNPVTLDQIESLFGGNYPSYLATAAASTSVVSDSSGDTRIYQIPNTSKKGDVAYGWRYYSDGTAISPTGQVYQDNEVVTLSDAEKGKYTGNLAGNLLDINEDRNKDAVTAASTYIAAQLVNNPTAARNISPSQLPIISQALRDWWAINPASQYTNANQIDTEAFRSYLRAQGISDSSIEYVVDASKTAVGELISKANVDVDTTAGKAKTILDTIGTKAAVTEADAATSAANIVKALSANSLSASNDAEVKAKAYLLELAQKSGQGGYVNASFINSIADAITKTASSGSNNPVDIVNNLLRNADFSKLSTFTRGGIDDLMGIVTSPWATEGTQLVFRQQLNEAILKNPEDPNLQREYAKLYGNEWTETDAGQAWIALNSIDTGSGSGGVGKVSSTLDAKGNVLYSTPVTYETVKGGSNETYTAYYNPATGETRYSLANRTGAISDFNSLSTVKPYLNEDGELTQEVKQVQVTATPAVTGSKTILFYDEDGKPVYKEDLDKITTFDPAVTVKPVVTVSPVVSVEPVVTPSVSASIKVVPTVVTTPVVTTTPAVSPSVTPEVTPEITPSISPSIKIVPTIVISPNVSVTPDVSVTPNVTPNVSVTPVVTPVITVTPVVTPEVSVTPVTSPQVSVTPGVTPVVSVTPDVSVTPIVTPETSVTPKVTPDVSVTPEVTPVVTVTPKVTPVVSVTPEVTPVVSVTPEVTPVVSVTPKVTPVVSVTPEVTPVVSVTPEVTPVVTVTPEVTPVVTVTPTIKPTVTPTITVKPTVTPTITVKPTVTPTVSIVPTITPSVSVTPTVTPSVSITPTPSIKPTPSITPTVTPSVTITPSVSVTPTPSVTPSITPTVTPSVSPTPSITPTVSIRISLTPTKSTQPFTMPQAQAIAAAFGIPALANVFYYGKEFGSKRQKLNKKGEIEEEDYRPLSVTKAGAEGELLEDIAEEKKNKENNANDALDLILGKSNDSMSFDDLINIVKGG